MKLRATLEFIQSGTVKTKLRTEDFVPRFKAVARITIDSTNCMQEQENIKERESRRDPITIGWKRWLNYQSLVKQVPFFLFLAALAVIYIYNGHYADKTIRNINRTAKEVKELQWEYKQVKSEVMFQSKQSELVKAVEPLGLKELTEAPVVLVNESKDKKNE